MATRVATLSGAENGAAHQAIRQFWIFAALGMDALAITAQSLVGYFVGPHRLDLARKVASVSCLWGVLAGTLLAAFMLVGQTWIAGLLVPPGAQAVFWPAWFAAAIIQPVNALAFVTDGINWGTADFRYLRNVMFVATGVGIAGLLLIDTQRAQRPDLDMDRLSDLDHHPFRAGIGTRLAWYWQRSTARSNLTNSLEKATIGKIAETNRCLLTKVMILTRN